LIILVLRLSQLLPIYNILEGNHNVFYKEKLLGILRYPEHALITFPVWKRIYSRNNSGKPLLLDAL